MKEAEELFEIYLAAGASRDESDFEAFLAQHADCRDELIRLMAEYERVRRLFARVLGDSLGFGAELPDDVARLVVTKSEHHPRALSDDNFLVETLGRLASRLNPFDRYDIKGEIARGGQGIIVRAWDPDLQRHLAIKVIRAKTRAGDPNPGNPDSRSIGRFIEEAQVTGQLDHPGIVPIHELGLDPDGNAYFAMKLVRGVSLKEIVDELHHGSQRWTLPRVLEVIVKVCEALAYAHSKSVIHRDIKPSNIMVGKFGEVYLMDWGLARVLGQADRRDLRIQDPARPSQPFLTSDVRSERREESGNEPDSPLITMDGDVVGTPSYMSPEQARGDLERVGQRSDVYSVGALLYHVLSGQIPYAPKESRVSSRTILLALLDGPPKALRLFPSSIPAELEAVCEKAMAREQEERYGSAGAVGEELRSFLEGRVVQAYETGASAELRKWVLRNRGFAGAIATALVILVGALALTTTLARTIASERRVLFRVTDVQAHKELVAEADELWPATPSLALSMHAWLDRARALVERRVLHEETLRELDHERERLGALDPQRERWRLTLRELVEGLRYMESSDLYGATIAALELRAERASSLAKDSLELYSDRWTEAIESIADETQSPQYAGLQLAPQLGLVPLGKDPLSGLWEFWHVRSGDEPIRKGDGTWALTEDTGLVLVLLPQGSFAMGAQRMNPDAPNYDPAAFPHEWPVRKTHLDAFFLSKYEMTQGQWLRATGNQPSHYREGYNASGKAPLKIAHTWTLTHPVDQVSWDMCTEVLARLQLALPTEAQWEYGCRAGSSTSWWAGNDRALLLEPCATARGSVNLADKSAQDAGAYSPYVGDWPELDDGYPSHGPVDAYCPNGFGLYNVHGNVWEWVADPYLSYEVDPRPGDGLRFADEDQEYRYMFRGGSFYFSSMYARSSMRFVATRDFVYDFTGVRPARAIQP